MQQGSPQTRFILCCTQRQLLGLLLLVAFPGLLILGCGWLLNDQSSLQVTCWSFGGVWLLATGWLIAALALSAHTGFYWTDITVRDDWP